MKVKCINIYNEYSKQHRTEDPWLTIGKEYIVLELEIYPTKRVLYRLVGDNENKMPALYDSSQFQIITASLSKNWQINQLKDGSLIIGPNSWQTLGFWEDCYDMEPKALEFYRREAKIIYKEEGAL